MAEGNQALTVSPQASAGPERVVSFEKEEEKAPFLSPLQIPGGEVEAEDVLTPLPSEITPGIFSRSSFGHGHGP